MHISPIKRKKPERSIASRASQSETLRHGWFILRMQTDTVRFKTCQWIDGEPKLRHFCKKKPQPKSSYCKEHHSRCYAKKPLTPKAE